MVSDKETVLKQLRRGEMATTTIAECLKRNYYLTLKILEELEIEGKVIRDHKPHQTFWRLK